VRYKEKGKESSTEKTKNTAKRDSEEPICFSPTSEGQRGTGGPIQNRGQLQFTIHWPERRKKHKSRRANYHSKSEKAIEKPGYRAEAGRYVHSHQDQWVKEENEFCGRYRPFSDLANRAIKQD
jgi:hypothetical protein